MRLKLQAPRHLRASACFLDWFSLLDFSDDKDEEELVDDDDGTHDGGALDRMLFVPEEDVDEECPESVPHSPEL